MEVVTASDLKLSCTNEGRWSIESDKFRYNNNNENTSTFAKNLILVTSLRSTEFPVFLQMNVFQLPT